MGVHERRRDRAFRTRDRLWREIGTEFRNGRLSLGLSQTAVGLAAGVSHGEVSRVERGKAPWLTIDQLCRLSVVIGLDPSPRFYPGPHPLRDAAHAALLRRFASRLHDSIRWQAEVPLPQAGDQRAWDGVTTGVNWRFGVEAEMRLADAQAVCRRIQLKDRDGGVDGVVLLLADTSRNRQAVRDGAATLSPVFPTPGREIGAALRAGRRPAGSGIVLL
jgi:transcriptional regulator with XRE-family HTH domain